jgi:hypothetical protein
LTQQLNRSLKSEHQRRRIPEPSFGPGPILKQSETIDLVDDEALEPCDVPKLPPLCAGTRAIARFLCVEENLLKTAYQPVQKKTRVDPPAALNRWIPELSASQKDKYLERFLSEPATVVRSTLLKEYRRSHPPAKTGSSSYQPRTAAALRAILEE